jgi:hypothetical protein
MTLKPTVGGSSACRKNLANVAGIGHSNTFTNEGGLKKAKQGQASASHVTARPKKSLRELSRSWTLLAQISYGKNVRPRPERTFDGDLIPAIRARRAFGARQKGQAPRCIHGLM